MSKVECLTLQVGKLRARIDRRRGAYHMIIVTLLQVAHDPNNLQTPVLVPFHRKVTVWSWGQTSLSLPLCYNERFLVWCFCGSGSCREKLWWHWPRRKARRSKILMKAVICFCQQFESRQQSSHHSRWAPSRGRKLCHACTHLQTLWYMGW